MPICESGDICEGEKRLIEEVVVAAAAAVGAGLVGGVGASAGTGGRSGEGQVVGGIDCRKHQRDQILEEEKKKQKLLIPKVVFQS